jgi:3-phenylpropionate/trans-cinnamate dioxygenase ferredoxin subunit
MSTWISVAAEKDFPPGMRQLVETETARILVFNLAGEYYAIEDICTHDGGSFDNAKLDDDAIICPRHGARFCIKTGEVLAPPAYEPVATFPVRVIDGIIQVKDERLYN